MNIYSKIFIVFTLTFVFLAICTAIYLTYCTKEIPVPQIGTETPKITITPIIEPSHDFIFWVVKSEEVDGEAQLQGESAATSVNNALDQSILRFKNTKPKNGLYIVLILWNGEKNELMFKEFEIK